MSPDQELRAMDALSAALSRLCEALETVGELVEEQDAARRQSRLDEVARCVREAREAVGTFDNARQRRFARPV